MAKALHTQWNKPRWNRRDKDSWVDVPKHGERKGPKAQTVSVKNAELVEKTKIEFEEIPAAEWLGSVKEEETPMCGACGYEIEFASITDDGQIELGKT